MSAQAPKKHTHYSQPFRSTVPQNTSLVACGEGGSADDPAARAANRRAAAALLVAAPCTLPPAVVLLPAQGGSGAVVLLAHPPGESQLVCPQPALASGGTVEADAAFTRHSGCGCERALDALELRGAGGGARLACADGLAAARAAWRRGMLLVGLLPSLSLLAISLVLRRRQLVKAAHRILGARRAAADADLAVKLSRFPGTPSVALVSQGPGRRQLAAPLPGLGFGAVNGSFGTAACWLPAGAPTPAAVGAYPALAPRVAARACCR